MHTSIYRRCPIARFDSRRVGVPVKFVAQGVQQSVLFFRMIDWFPQVQVFNTGYVSINIYIYIYMYIYIYNVCVCDIVASGYVHCPTLLQPSERSMFLMFRFVLSMASFVGGLL